MTIPMASEELEHRVVWLHATDPALVPTLEVLADQLEDQDEPPHVIVTGQQTPGAPKHDDTRAIDTFLEANSIDVLVLAGTTLPVRLVERAHSRGVAIFLVDAEHPMISKRWKVLPGHTRAVLSKFTHIHTRNAQTAASLQRLVRDTVPVFDTGTLARFAPAQACNASELEAMRKVLGSRLVWFAFDLPMSEAEATLMAHAHALRRTHRLLMILQPRDPQDGEALAERARALGFACAMRSLDEDIDEGTQVYIADSEDDPGLFVRLASVAFLGGSLTPKAGCPQAMTAAALGCALIFGPHADKSQEELLAQLHNNGGGRKIDRAPALGGALETLLAPEAGAEAALKAWTLATDGSEATNSVARAIMDWFQLNRGRK